MSAIRTYVPRRRIIRIDETVNRVDEADGRLVSAGEHQVLCVARLSCEPREPLEQGAFQGTGECFYGVLGACRRAV